MRKLLSGLAAATALSLAPLAAVGVASAPAATAAEAYTTKATIKLYKTRGEAGDYQSITGAVDSSGGSPAGTAYLQRKDPGKGWKNVSQKSSSSTSLGFISFSNFKKLTTNAQFRIFFVGGTDSSGNTYASSVSGVKTVKVFRNMKAVDTPGRNARIKITVRPNFTNKRLVVFKGVNGRFKRVKGMRTNKRGVAFKVFEGSRKGIRYRVIAPGNRNFQTTGIKFTITRYSY